MNNINVPNTELPATDNIIADLKSQLDELTPELRKAATYVLDNPNDVGVSSIREMADAANVKPNTFVRMAREIGFDGYDDFRTPFREEIRQGRFKFEDRARWLQSLSKGGKLDSLYADMVQAAIQNLEETFSNINSAQLKDAAQVIWDARQVFTLGVGVNHSNAQNFTYLASTGMVQFYTIPKAGSRAIDDLAWADHRDTLIAITCKPYRTEVIEAVKLAKEQDMTVIAISDSAGSPIIMEADHGFIIASETPQFFPSSVSTVALLETLLSFVVAVASEEIIERVEKFHQRRYELGLYEVDPGELT